MRKRMSLERAERIAAFRACINELKEELKRGNRYRADALDRAAYGLLVYSL